MTPSCTAVGLQTFLCSPGTQHVAHVCRSDLPWVTLEQLCFVLMSPLILYHVPVWSLVKQLIFVPSCASDTATASHFKGLSIVRELLGRYNVRSQISAKQELSSTGKELSHSKD